MLKRIVHPLLLLSCALISCNSQPSAQGNSSLSTPLVIRRFDKLLYNYLEEGKAEYKDQLRNEYSGMLDVMTKGVLNKDWPLLAAAAHKIIPSFAIMGMSHELENTAKQIQEAANAEQFTDETANMVVQLESICRQACQELELEFNLIKNT